ncbi:unnamed protein product [Phyllotreta striolata]|uniref:Uncharacterized protein n=1 Tax=Phyllotreta striolata TaxID=444603 RepID=A0A9N9TL39_PHYSR|nr:unnamed protein product [Phyllotreta striolata]
MFSRVNYRASERDGVINRLRRGNHCQNIRGSRKFLFFFFWAVFVPSRRQFYRPTCCSRTGQEENVNLTEVRVELPISRLAGCDITQEAM